MNESPMMTLNQVADYLKVHPSTIYRQMKKHGLPGFKIGRDWRYNREHIEQWCQQQERNGNGSSRA